MKFSIVLNSEKKIKEIEGVLRRWDPKETHWGGRWSATQTTSAFNNTYQIWAESKAWKFEIHFIPVFNKLGSIAIKKVLFHGGDKGLATRVLGLNL